MASHLTRRIVGVGCALGVGALALFASLHALVVTPVWSQLARVLPFVMAIGVAVAWAYHEFVQAVPNRVNARGGFRFGVMLWLAALPATALANVVRIQQGGSLPVWAYAAAFVLALACGAAMLGGIAKSRRAAVAGAVAAVALLAAAAGPLPVLRNGRVAELWFGLLVLETAGGVLLALLYKSWILPITPPVAKPGE